MNSYDLDRVALRNYGMKRERSTSPFHFSTQFDPFGPREEQMMKTVSLSAVCKEDIPYYTRSGSPTLSPPFSWRQGSPELGPYDFAWNRPDLSRMTSPLSSHAECSLTEDGSNTLSPHIASTFDPSDYTNANSFPASPREAWIPIEDAGYHGHTYQSIPFGNGSSSAILNVAPYNKVDYGLHMPAPLPSHGLPLFANDNLSRPRKRKLSSHLIPHGLEDEEYNPREVEVEDDGEGESDYSPRPRKNTKITRSPKVVKTKQTKTRLIGARQVNNAPSRKQNAELEKYIAKNTAYGITPCPHCQEQFHGKTELVRHVAALHTRMFACTFNIYGCQSTFGSKNEWKRHVATKHLRTGYWLCEMGRCAPTKPDAQPKEFNRKDLFMQHVRRMHMPTYAKDKAEVDASIDNIARECYKHVRDPPPRSICGYCYAAGKPEDFSGPGSWEHRMEHVGKHLETPGGLHKQCCIDQELEDWLIKEEIIVNDGTGSLILRSILEDGRSRT